MSSPYRIGRIEAEALAAGQPAQQAAPQIHARQPHQRREQTMLRIHMRRVAVGAEQAAAFERRKRAAIAVLANAVEDNVEPAGQNAGEVFVPVIDWRSAELADQRRVLAACAA